MRHVHSKTSVWLHLAWTTKNKEPFLRNSVLKRDLFSVIGNITTKLKLYLDTVSGYKDHIHLMIRLPEDQDVIAIINHIKEDTCEFFRKHPGKQIAWDEGFVAFTIHREKLDE